MPHIRVLSTGARITGGIFCLLLALHTWIWVLRDFIEFDADTLWNLWTGALGRGAGDLTAMPATTSSDLGLGLLQLAAVFAAFTGAWTAGGLMAATAALTFVHRLPVIWAAALHSESSPFYSVRDFYNDDALAAAGLTSVLVLLLCVVLAIVLLAGIRPWPRPSGPATAGWPVPGGPHPYGQPQPAQPPMPPEPEPPLPSESPQRPTGPHTAVAGSFLGLLVVFNIGWTIHALVMSSGGFWVHYLTGEGIVFSLLDLPPAWSWLTMILLAGTGSVLSLARGVAARGFTLGLAFVVLPSVLVGLWQLLSTGAFFDLGDVAPVLNFFSRLHMLITLLGAVTLVVLALRPGVPAQPRVPGPPGAPFGGGPAPFGAPQGQPQPYFPQPGPAQPYAQQPPQGMPHQGQPHQGQPPNVPPQPAAPPQQPGSPPGYGYPPPPETPGPPGGGFGPPPPPAN